MEEFGTLQKFCRVAKISQPVEFRRLQNFSGCEFSQPAPMSNLTHFDQFFVTFS